MYAARLRLQYDDGMGRRAGNWRGREENIWTSMSLPYHVTNVGQFTNPIMPNATDDAAVYGLLRQYAFGTGIEPASKMDVRLLRNFRAAVTHICSSRGWIPLRGASSFPPVFASPRRNALVTIPLILSISSPFRRHIRPWYRAKNSSTRYW